MDFRISRAIFVGVAFTSGLMLAEACQSSKANSNHCSFLEGDSTCEERYPGELVYCGGDCVDSEHNDGCVEEVPDDCYYPCGDDMLAEDDMSCLGMTMSDSVASTMDSSSDPSGDPTTMDDSSTMTMTGGETETDPTETTGPSGCQMSDDCTDPDRPVCSDNDCVPCTETPDGDLACNSKDEAAPVCNDAGQCVQCEDGNAAACSDTTPICDPGTSTCVGCTYHEQCADTACDIGSGACIDGAVIHVDGDVGCPGGGTEADPYCNIQAGIDAVGGEGVVIVHATAGSYDENLEVNGPTVAILVAEGESTPVLENDLATSTLVMTGAGTKLYLEGVSFENNNSAVALSLSDGVAWLDRVEVVANSSAGSGVEILAGADVHLRSSIVGANGGGGFTGLFGVSVDGATLDLVGSTVAFNDTQGPAPASLVCEGGTITVRNSIIVAEDAPSVSCDGDLSYSAVDTDVGGATNVVLDAFDFEWFDSLGPGGFRLGTNGDAFADIALVEAGDYPFDIDGEPRPAAGAMDHAGADTP